MSPEEDYSSYNKNVPSKQDWLKPASQLGKLNSAYIGKREGGRRRRERRELGCTLWPKRGEQHTLLFTVWLAKNASRKNMSPGSDLRLRTCSRYAVNSRDSWYD